MSPTVAGGIAAGIAVLGVLVLFTASRRRRSLLMVRLEPYVHTQARGSSLLDAPVGAERTVSGALLGAASSLSGFLESLGSSAESVRQRLVRSGSSLSLEELRLQQLACAVAAAAGALGLGLALSVVHHVSIVLIAVAGAIAAVAGAAGRDWWLSQAVHRRRRRIESQLPDVVELLALVIGAGQAPVAALERVVGAGHGDLIDELRRTLADVRSGTVLSTALARLSARVDSVHVTRLCEAFSVALERGTPLAEVLRAQAADVRESSRRALMEEGGKREIAQMVPVVFLVLPVTVVFALFPGLYVLRLGL